MRRAAFIAVGCFEDGGWDEDDPWREHLKWFPNCVYDRFVMDGNELRPASAAADGSNLSRHRCTII